MDDNLQTFKIVLIGSVNTGKTNIASRYIKNQFKQNTTATVGVQFMRKIVSVGNQQVKVTLWDTAGQERYKSLSKVYYKGASGVIIVYDITNHQSYQDVEGWMKLVNENLNLGEIVVMILGNKIDMNDQRKVPADRAEKQYKQKLDIDCREVSAKTGQKIDDAFRQMVQKIYQKHKDTQLRNQQAMRQQEQARKAEQASKNEQVKIIAASIKKQPQVKNKKTTLEKEVKSREKASKEKSKGCC